MRCRIYLNIERPDSELVEKLRGVPTAYLVDAMGRHGAMHYSIKPVISGMKLCGPAVTVWGRPRDNLLAWKSMEVAQPGDVLVFAYDGYEECAHWGDNNAKAGIRLKLAGAVIDGMIRDLAGHREIGFPVFARGVCPNSPFKSGPGEINVPVVCGGVIVHPGDVIVGDDDGVVVVPKDELAVVISKLPAIREKEAKREKEIEAGDIFPSGLRAALDALDCEIIT